MLAIIKGIVMNDFVKESVFDGVKSESRIVQIYQKGSDDKELVEVKEVPEAIKFKDMENVTLPVTIKSWRNERKQSGVTVKYFKEA